jgi:hypothetical protein
MQIYFWCVRKQLTENYVTVIEKQRNGYDTVKRVNKKSCVEAAGL